MEKLDRKIEHEPVPKDISAEFLSMSVSEFMDFLRTQRKEPSLSITIDWKDVPRARRLRENGVNSIFFNKNRVEKEK